MRYGSLEHMYAQPFAAALVADPDFRNWVLRRTKFGDAVEPVRLLHEEMSRARSANAATWWRSHFSESCRCEGCCGQETDVLAIFERQGGARFAVHVEVKQPTDIFPKAKNQARNYALRARCWVSSPPRAILAHRDADTLLLCSAAKLREYQPHLEHFGGVITFEEVTQAFPSIKFG